MIELRNWLLCFRCASEEFSVVVTNLADWLVTPPPPPLSRLLCSDGMLHRCNNMRPGVRPIGIWETLRQAITKIVMRAAGDQAKTACKSLQLCAGLEAGIEGATHAMEQRRRERTMPVPGGGGVQGISG